MALKLKEFDFKGFLLEKGERVGLYVAGGIAFLMIVLSLFLPGKGLLSPSPKKSAEDMVKLSDNKKGDIANAHPSDAEADELRKVPAELQKQAGNVAEDPDLFRFTGELFVPREIPSNKRQNPNVLGPVEFAAAVVPAEISSYMILNERDGVRIGIVQNSGRKLASKSPLDRMKEMFGPRGPGGMSPPAGMSPPGIGMPGGFDERKRGFGSGGMPMPPGPGGANPFGEDRKNAQITYVRKDELAGIPNPVFGRELMPVMMAKVVGAFPLKQQIEEFKSALRAESAYDVVFQETVGDKDKVRRAFDFLGFKVQRRAYGPDGKVIKSAEGKEWQDLDLETQNSAYIATVAQVLKEFDPEDPRIAPLLVHGLYLPQPVQIANKDGVPKPYPQIEKTLPKVQQTLEKMKEKESPALPPTKLDDGTFNPFGDPEAEKTGPEGANTTLPTAAEWSPPEYCVLRFLDLTIQPGQTYEYQVMVRMRNPNFGKPESEVANKQLATMPELDSDWYPVKGPDGKMVRVSVVTDLHLYAVDQMAVAKESGDKYKGMNANVTTYDTSRQVPLQIHRWEGQLEVNTGKETRFYAVGDWIVGQRIFASRGEYVGTRPVATHIPAWSAEQNQFILAGRPPAKAGRGADTRPTEPVSFLDSKRAPLLVDFEAGSLTYRHAAAPVPKNEDGTPVEGYKAQPTTEVKSTTGIDVLLLTPDGKLIGHSAARDEPNKDRVEREKEYADRVAEADDKDPGKPATGGKPGDPFSGGSPSKP